jgi:hypothetical protein
MRVEPQRDEPARQAASSCEVVEELSDPPPLK